MRTLFGMGLCLVSGAIPILTIHRIRYIQHFKIHQMLVDDHANMEVVDAYDKWLRTDLINQLLHDPISFSKN